MIAEARKGGQGPAWSLIGRHTISPNQMRPVPFSGSLAGKTESLPRNHPNDVMASCGRRAAHDVISGVVADHWRWQDGIPEWFDRAARGPFGFPAKKHDLH